MMNYFIIIAMALLFLSSCGGHPRVAILSDDGLASGSVSPRAERSYMYSYEGHQSASGSNPAGRFDRELAEREKRRLIEMDTLRKEFAVNGYSVNTTPGDCELYSTRAENERDVKVRADR